MSTHTVEHHQLIIMSHGQLPLNLGRAQVQMSTLVCSYQHRLWLVTLSAHLAVVQAKHIVRYVPAPSRRWLQQERLHNIRKEKKGRRTLSRTQSGWEF